jgi:DNA-binding Lrp family transcriptional regulator
MVPLDQIVGSVGRYNDFDNRFRLKSHIPQERLQRVKKAMLEGRPLSPVKLYQIKNEYFALDGNHRIAAAKELGRKEINANIVEFMPGKETLENIIYNEKAAFRDETGLKVPIQLTEMGQYRRLLKQISKHQNHLQTNQSKPVTIQSAAKDWHATIYHPLTTIIRRGGLLKRFPNRTLDDLYAYISFHQWEKGPKRRYGIGIDRLIPKDMEAFRDKMANNQPSEYPEMLRGVTAFILMQVDARKEDRIVDKLFALEEVREVHSVHGNIDMIVKIVLTRDLLSSDSEIIAQFVQHNVRQIPGVRSTQTLLPGLSKIKE